MQRWRREWEYYYFNTLCETREILLLFLDFPTFIPT